MYRFYCVTDWKLISNTQSAILSVRELNERRKNIMWNMSTSDKQDDVTVMLETGNSYNQTGTRYL